MINRLKLRNFRKHENLDIAFGPGLQIIRGANEHGKTTIIESISYALFGSKALRDSLADVVTWGCNEKDLAVELVIDIDGRSYTFKRSKAGAEVVLDAKVFVTGQNEVSGFAAQLLGAEVNVATQLMLAGQGNLRGTLEAGPKATSALIESLANLDIIETIIERAQERLTLGSTAVLQDRLKAAQLALAETEVGNAPDRDVFLTTLAFNEEQKAKLAASVVELEAAHKAARDAFLAEDENQKAVAQIERDIATLTTQRMTTITELAAAREDAEVHVEDPAPIEARLRDAEQHAAAVKAWDAFVALPKSALSYNRDAWNSEYRALKQSEADLQQSYNKVQADIRVLEAQRMTSTICPSCGQDTAHLPAVQEKARKIDADLAAAKAQIKEMEALDALNDRALDALTPYQEADAQVRPAYKIGNQYVSIDETVIPAAVAWVGPTLLNEAPDVPALKAKLASIKGLVAARDKARGRVEALTRTLTLTDDQIAAAKQRQAGIGAVSADEFRALNLAFIDAASALSKKEEALEDVCSQIEEDRRLFNALTEAYNQATAKIDEMKKQEAQIAADIKTVEFNNALVKKIRAARPIIANKLWGMVLSCVSNLFSQIRGETSIVTKEKDGFMVNGRPITSLSGSTLDILGQSIRVSLLKTFLPACSFLVLDEPFASMDEGRTSSSLSFLRTLGITQCILVTHEDMSSAIADNIIDI